LIRETRSAAFVRKAIEEADQAFTPSIVLAEVAGASYRSGIRDGDIVRQLIAIRESSAIVRIDPVIAVKAARALDELRSHARERKASLPGLADALILATARDRQARVLTGDPHFQGFPETVWIR
jgi:predicted nucleic acid-binding protein